MLFQNFSEANQVNSSFKIDEGKNIRILDQFITDFQLPFIIDNQDNFKDSNKGMEFILTYHEI